MPKVAPASQAEDEKPKPEVKDAPKNEDEKPKPEVKDAPKNEDEKPKPEVKDAPQNEDEKLKQELSNKEPAIEGKPGKSEPTDEKAPGADGESHHCHNYLRKKGSPRKRINLH